MDGENPYQPPQGDASDAARAATAKAPPQAKTRWRLGPAMLLFMFGSGATLTGLVFLAVGGWQMIVIATHFHGPFDRLFDDPQFLRGFAAVCGGGAYLIEGILFLASAHLLWIRRWWWFAGTLLVALIVYGSLAALAPETPSS